MKNKTGRKPDAPGTTVELNFAEIDRQDNMPFIIINGAGRRIDTTPITLPIPNELHKRIKGTANVSAALVALMVYGLEQIDKADKTLLANYSKVVKEPK
ncbi:MAG: hypothetical protein GY710_05925 [Desulfobacteraceae bacterium]|nr:hypothetical protein [Desulfobacteraceae bacterium]